VILVIGATGNVGGAAVRDLAAAGVKVRALSRNPARVPSYGPHVEAVQGDVERPESVAEAMKGVDRILLCAGGSDLPTQEADVIRLAEEASVTHLVLLSSLGVELGAGSGPVHEPSERRLRASSLPWTILRPITFMSNALRWRDSIAATGTFEEPTGTGTQAMIHPADIGSVAARVLTTSGHEGRTYELTGPEALSSAEYAAKLSAALGRPVRHVDIPEDVFRERFNRFGAPPSFVQAMVTFYALIRGGNLAMVTPDVQELLGRPGRSFDEWAWEHAAAFHVP
jgi:uncharacterized protein YbjT (DUF2867 family)